jgi:hypothetical protein
MKRTMATPIPGGARTRPRTLEELYAELAKSTDTAPNWQGVEAVNKGRKEQSQRNFAAGMALSMLGGESLAPAGRLTMAEAADLARPLRPNEADVGYTDPVTGKISENPSNAARRREKALLAQIAFGEKADLAEAARQVAKERVDEAARQREADRDLRREIAGSRQGRQEPLVQTVDEQGNVVWTPRSQAVGQRTTRPNVNAPKPLSPAAQKEQADLAQQLNSVDLALNAVKASPSAFGKVRGIPGGVAGQFGESVMGTMDTDAETDARAQVYNVVSSVIKARAGTAQSAHELRVLNSFLPSPYDNATQIEGKMKGFKQYLEGQKKSHLEEVTGGARPAAAPAASGAPVIDFGSLK